MYADFLWLYNHLALWPRVRSTVEARKLEHNNPHALEVKHRVPALIILNSRSNFLGFTVEARG